MINLIQPLLAQTENAETATEAVGPWAGSFWFPEQASDFAAYNDDLFHLILWICLANFIPMMLILVWFCIKYRKRKGYVQEKSTSHNNAIEIAWSVLPSLILLVLFLKGVYGFMDSRVPPEDAYQIQVQASQFAWNFTYPNGEQTEELHVPKDVDVKFLISSKDVLHSFFIPAFRIKRDAVPGRYVTAWARATKTGRYRLYCAEYCGDGHSLMKKTVVVHDLTWDEMMKKIEWKEEDHTSIENGERQYKIRCAGCHSIDGSKKTGPSFQDTSSKFGQEVAMTNGSKVKIDESFIRESILEPAKNVRSGFTNQMTSFQGQLNDEQIGHLIDYIKSLNGSAN